MNEQNPTPPREELDGSSSPSVASFQAYGNAGVMREDGSSSLADDPAQAFMKALQDMEKDRNANRLAEQFSHSCKLWRQSYSHSYEGHERTLDFWNEYLNQFQSIETNFTNVLERDDLAVLEWESRGALQGGRPIHYRGVSILEFDEENKVKTFKTYFDSAHFISIQG
jgi:hypothetical protein